MRDTNGYPELSLGDATDTNRLSFYYDLSGNTGIIRTGSAYPLLLQTNNVTKVTILSDGKVGIGGASTPIEPLDVWGNRILVGSNVGSNNNSRTTGTGKYGSYCFPHLTNATLPWTAMSGYSSTGSKNELYIGGTIEGLGYIAATDLYFYTAADQSTENTWLDESEEQANES